MKVTNPVNAPSVYLWNRFALSIDNVSEKGTLQWYQSIELAQPVSSISEENDEEDETDLIYF